MKKNTIQTKPQIHNQKSEPTVIVDEPLDDEEEIVVIQDHLESPSHHERRHTYSGLQGSLSIEPPTTSKNEPDGNANVFDRLSQGRRSKLQNMSQMNAS